MPGITLPLPASLAGLLAVFGLLSTAPSFRTFRGRACGFPVVSRKYSALGASMSQPRYSPSRHGQRAGVREVCPRPKAYQLGMIAGFR